MKAEGNISSKWYKYWKTCSWRNNKIESFKTYKTPDPSEIFKTDQFLLHYSNIHYISSGWAQSILKSGSADAKSDTNLTKKYPTATTPHGFTRLIKPTPSWSIHSPKCWNPSLITLLNGWTPTMWNTSSTEGATTGHMATSMISQSKKYNKKLISSQAINSLAIFPKWKRMNRAHRKGN